jgi:hypothetical protein
VEREPFWRAEEPGTGTCVPIAGYGTYCWPCHVEFDGADTDIVVSDNAAIQDLHNAAMTVDGWIRADTEGESSAGIIAVKGNPSLSGWVLQMSTPMRIHATIACATTDGDAVAQSNILTAGTWYHIAMTWDDASYAYPRLWIDGIETVYNSTQNRNGAIVTDVGADLYIGELVVPGGLAFDGGIGWLRVSDIARYTASFTPPRRCVLPEIDVNTVGQWIGAECSGATIDNQEGTAAIDGTLSDGSFDCDCTHYYGNILESYCDPSFLTFNGSNSDVDFGSGVSLDNLPDGGAIQVEAWIRARGWGEANQGRIVMKQAGAAGWTLHLNSTNGLVAQVSCVGQAAFSMSGTDEFSPDGQWHHVLMVYDETGTLTPVARTVYLAVDGEWVSSYTFQQVSIGAYGSDAALDLHVGNDSTAINTFDGDIGWVRVKGTITVTVGDPFGTGARCTFPAVGGGDVLLAIQEGAGATAADQSGYGNDGTIANCTWACDCESPVETTIAPSCEE